MTPLPDSVRGHLDGRITGAGRTPSRHVDIECVSTPLMMRRAIVVIVIHSLLGWVDRSRRWTGQRWGYAAGSYDVTASDR